MPALTASYSGFVNGDTAASLTTQPTVITAATAASHVGTYSIAASGAVDSDYTITYAGGTLVVIPATVTVTADNKTKAYGAALPTLTYTVTGLVGSETLTTLPTLSTSATAASHVGSYAITAAGASASSDYTLSYIDGTLSVTPAPLTITADNKTKIYGSALPALTATCNGLVNGDTPASLSSQPTLSTTATAASHVGTYVITASGAVDSDYTMTQVNGTMLVSPATLTITAGNKTKVYGTALPTLTAGYTGFVNGDTTTSLTSPPTITTTATAVSPVGVYPTTAANAVALDYTMVYVAGVMAVTPAATTTAVVGSPSPSVVGQTVTFTATLRAQSVGGRYGQRQDQLLG